MWTALFLLNQLGLVAVYYLESSRAAGDATSISATYGVRTSVLVVLKTSRQRVR